MKLFYIFFKTYNNNKLYSINIYFNCNKIDCILIGKEFSWNSHLDFMLEI